MRKQFEYYILDGLLSGMFNMYSQDKTNNHNRRLSEEERNWQYGMAVMQNQYNSMEADKARAYNTSERIAQENFIQAQNQTLFDREDTAHSRAVVDAVNAGLSPLAAVGSGAQASLVSGAPSGSGVSSASASSVPSPASYRAQPSLMNLDMSSLIGAVMDNNKMKLEKEKINNDKAIAEGELELKSDIENKKLLQEGSQFAEMKAMEEDHFLKDYAQRAEQFSAQTAQQQLFHYDDLVEKDKQRAFEDLQASNKTYVEMAQSMAQSAGIPVVYYPVTNVDDYNKGISAVSKYLSAGNQKVISDWNSDKFKSSVQNNKAGNIGGSVSGVGAGSLGASVGSGENRDNVAREAVKNAYIKNGVLRVPVLVRNYAEWKKDYSSLNDNKSNDNKSNDNKKSNNAPNRTITEFTSNGTIQYNPYVKSKVWSK